MAARHSNTPEHLIHCFYTEHSVFPEGGAGEGIKDIYPGQTFSATHASDTKDGRRDERPSLSGLVSG